MRKDKYEEKVLEFKQQIRCEILGLAKEEDRGKKGKGLHFEDRKRLEGYKEELEAQVVRHFNSVRARNEGKGEVRLMERKADPRVKGPRFDLSKGERSGLG
jgi:hypothetical protein